MYMHIWRPAANEAVWEAEWQRELKGEVRDIDKDR